MSRLGNTQQNVLISFAIASPPVLAPLHHPIGPVFPCMAKAISSARQLCQLQAVMDSVAILIKHRNMRGLALLSMQKVDG